MFMRSTAVWMLLGALAAGPAWSQSRPAQQPGDTGGGAQASETRDGQPVFRVVVVGRTAKAINFRPRDGETKIDFVGTTLSPEARGDATVEGEDGVIEIDANFESLESPRKFGPEYLTYVLWAITPEGRTSNLGELQVSGDDGELLVTTELQAFGLIVTAEPYFAVTRPSNVVVMESAPREEGIFRDRTEGRIELIDAKYELLERGTYTLNTEPVQLKAKPLEPGAPLDLAQARNAVAIARLAGADRYAAETFGKASQLLAEAEQARERGRRGDEVQQPARQAVQTAEDARLIAVRRIEEENQAQQRALAQQREEELRRQQAEAERREIEARERAQAERERAQEERARALAEEARRQQADAERLKAEADRAAAERARAEAAAAAERAKAEIDAAQRARAEADAAAARLAQERQAAEADRLAAEQARAAAEAQAQQARAAAEQAEREKAEAREQLRQQLNQVLETRETARGLIVNVSDVLFDFDSANLKPGAREKLARVAGILLTQPGLDVQVEGHTDSIGSDSYNQRLSESRAASVRDYLVRQGIQPGAVGTAGFGESQPVVSNDTAAGRQQNRRVELVVTGEAIGTTTTRTTTETTTETTQPAR
jgi:outer membrane protein OmpA-like peptidoglycan-associated protein